MMQDKELGIDVMDDSEGAPPADVTAEDHPAHATPTSCHANL